MNSASNIMFIHKSSESMMAVLQEDDGNYIHDQTLQYMLLLLYKVALNTTVLFFWLQSIHKSFIGICSISIYLADLLLTSSIAWAWWFKQNINAHAVMCFSLSHSSTMYSLLPLPVLLAGTIDYATHQHVNFHQTSVCRTVSRYAAVLLMWTLVGFYSYCFTNTKLFTVKYMKGIKGVACPVQGSAIVSHFSLTLLIAVGFILLLYFRKLPRWIRLANKLAKQWARSHVHMSDLALSRKLDKLEGGSETGQKMHTDDLQDRPSLFISLTLCFTLCWIIYLLIGVICDLMAFPVPAYASVNLLWTACANSLLVGITFWYNSSYHGPLSKLPDDICTWNFYWHLSKENCQLSASTKLHDGLSTTFLEKKNDVIY